MARAIRRTPGARRIGGGPTRSVAAASWTALGALLLRDVVVLRKHLWEFVLRTVIQPFLLCFVFLYVFPKIGQGIGGHGAAAQEDTGAIDRTAHLYALHGASGRSAQHATILCLRIAGTAGVALGYRVDKPGFGER